MASTSEIALLQAAAGLALAGAPLYWLQGRTVRQRTPRLDEAPGQRSGTLPGSPPALRIVGLGESPMAAVGLQQQDEGVTPRLATQLAETTGQRIEWQTAARSGATARLTLETLLPQITKDRTDWVLVALGVNDCLALRSAKRWRETMEQLTSAIAHRLEPGGIIFTGIPPMQHFPALPFPLATMLGLRARLLDTVLAGLAASSDLLFHAPMTFVESPDGLFCRDGFHPNARAHQLWAGQLADLIHTAASGR